MKKLFVGLLYFVLLCGFVKAEAQCSVCTRTAQQLGEKPAKGLNAGILYLAFTPLALVAGLGWWWWRKQKASA